MESKGNWKGDILVLETPGPNRFLERERELLEKTYKRAHCVSASFQLTPDSVNYGIGPALQYTKISVLTDGRFRAYNKLFYLDSDAVIKRSAHPVPSFCVTSTSIC